LIEVFISPFPFTTCAFVVFFATAFDFATVLAFALDLAFASFPGLMRTEAFAVTLTSTLASALIVMGEEMPPTKLTTEPSKIIVFTKLVQTFILSRVGILSSLGGWSSGKWKGRLLAAARLLSRRRREIKLEWLGRLQTRWPAISASNNFSPWPPHDLTI